MAHPAWNVVAVGLCEISPVIRQSLARIRVAFVQQVGKEGRPQAAKALRLACRQLAEVVWVVAPVEEEASPVRNEVTQL